LREKIGSHPRMPLQTRIAGKIQTNIKIERMLRLTRNEQLEEFRNITFCRFLCAIPSPRIHPSTRASGGAAVEAAENRFGRSGNAPMFQFRQACGMAAMVNDIVEESGRGRHGRSMPFLAGQSRRVGDPGANSAFAGQRR